MAFGWSFPKLALLLTLGFFLVGIPVLTYAMALRDRWRRRASRDAAEDAGRQVR
ncbi:MAG: hypothetical protein ACUVYA_04500 [Planctomycetota bacterium]